MLLDQTPFLIFVGVVHLNGVKRIVRANRAIAVSLRVRQTNLSLSTQNTLRDAMHRNHGCPQSGTLQQW
jgi:hypothetical protein